MKVTLEQIRAMTAGYVPTESELRNLASLSLASAIDAIRQGHYSVASAALDEAKGHLRALREARET